MSSVDERICLYYQLFGKAQSIVDSTERMYDKACGTCRGNIRHWKSEEKIWVCGACPGGVEWGFKDIDILKGEMVGSRRPGQHEDKIAGLSHFGYHLNRMLRDDAWKWSAQLLIGHALTSCSYEEIAEHANTYGWPTKRGGAWSEDRARRDASLARKELRKRLSDTPKQKLAPQSDASPRHH